MAPLKTYPATRYPGAEIPAPGGFGETVSTFLGAIKERNRWMEEQKRTDKRSGFVALAQAGMLRTPGGQQQPGAPTIQHLDQQWPIADKGPSISDMWTAMKIKGTQPIVPSFGALANMATFATPKKIGKKMETMEEAQMRQLKSLIKMFSGGALGDVATVPGLLPDSEKTKKRIQVKVKPGYPMAGQIGDIDESEFDSNIYERM